MSGYIGPDWIIVVAVLASYRELELSLAMGVAV